MPVAAAIPALAGAVSSFFGNREANNIARDQLRYQEDLTRNAMNLTYSLQPSLDYWNTAGRDEAYGIADTIRDQLISQYMPFLQFGQDAMGKYGANVDRLDPRALMEEAGDYFTESPGQKYAHDRAQEALTARQRAGGGLYGSDTMDRAGQIATDYALMDWNNFYDDYSGGLRNYMTGLQYGIDKGYGAAGEIADAWGGWGDARTAASNNYHTGKHNIASMPLTTYTGQQTGQRNAGNNAFTQRGNNNADMWSDMASWAGDAWRGWGGGNGGSGNNGGGQQQFGGYGTWQPEW